MNHWSALKADTYRQYGHYRFWSLLKGAIRNRTFRVVVTMRLCNIIANSNIFMRTFLPFFKILHKLSSSIACMDFPWGTHVDGGVSLPHGWGIVVNQGVTIGKNVTIFHGATLGRRDKISKSGERYTEYPRIEEEVWIGPHAIIVGGVTIGRGSRIAGGSFVIESVPPFSTVMGNPSKIVRNNCTPDVMNPAP